MTTPPEEPFRGGEFPPLEHGASHHPGAGAPVDYPTAYPPLPPPVYPGYPAYGGYPGYPSYDLYGQGKPPGTNGKAVASLVTSLAGLVFCGLPSIAGFVLGIIAMRECRRSGQDGYGLALAGTIIGGLVTALVVLYVIIVFGVFASGFQYAP